MVVIFLVEWGIILFVFQIERRNEGVQSKTCGPLKQFNVFTSLKGGGHIIVPFACPSIPNCNIIKFRQRFGHAFFPP